MSEHRVICRAFGGEPLLRYPEKVANGLVYVTNPDRPIRSEDPYFSPVGFPIEDVFCFDINDMERLRAKYQQTQSTDWSDWTNMVEFRPR